MSTIDEKLRNFERTVIHQATQDRDELLEELERRTAQELQETRALYERDAKERHRKGLEDVKKEARYVVSEAQNNGQNALVSKRNEIMDSVFEELRERLRQFTDTPEYLAFFQRKTTEALTNAAVHLGDRQGQIEIQITQKDFDTKKEEILSRVEHVFLWAVPKVSVCEEDIIGGCRVLLPEYGRVIDNSILSAILLERESFLSWSNLSLK